METYLWFVVFNILLVKVFATLTLSTSSSYAVENQDYILTCQSSVVTTAIVWERNDINVVTMYIQSNVCSTFDGAGTGLLPNYRYNCTDNKTFNLIIPGDRIRQEDGSKWQCKNSGGGYGSSVLNLRMARPPTSDPVVTGYSGTILYPGNTLKLTCTVQGGTPLATLSWTCKGSYVTATDKSTTTTAISEVTVNIDSSYNGQVCVCKVEHLSWTIDKTAESQQFVVYSFATLTLSSSSTYAVENQDYILTCQSSVVTTAIAWARNDINVVTMYIQSNVCGTFDGAGAGLLPNYRYNCTDNKAYNLVIPGDRILQEDGSKWQCKDSGGGVGQSVILTLSVARPPTSASVVTGYSGTILYPGNTLKLTCTVQGGTPLATLSWTCKGSSVTGADKSTTTTAISEVTVNIDSSYNGQVCVCKAEHLSWITDKFAESQHFVVYYPPSSDPVVSGYHGSKLYVNNNLVLTCHVTGGYPLATLSWTCDEQNYPGTNRSVVNTAISELSITATANLNGKSCTCKGRHSVTSYSRDSNSATFVVHYASSESPVITGYVSGQPIYKGNRQLECKVSGGYPLSILTMTCNNIVISGTDQSTSTESKFIYNIIVDKTYSKQQCICNGRHPDQNIGYNRNTSVTFNVYFAPDTAPLISGYTNNQIIYEPENKDLTCRVTGGNPLATLTWTCRGLSVSGINQSVEGEARSTITLGINRDYNNKQCICRATHLADNYNRQTNVTFTVYYVDLFTMASNRKFDNTQDIQLICSSKGNVIGMIFHSWTHKIGSITVRTLNGSNSMNQTVLVIPYSSYQDVGTYTCYVYNSNRKLMKSKDIEVTVYDKPVITETIKIQENDNHGELIVDFYSVPKPLKVEWSTKGSIISLSEKYRQSNTIVPISLTLHNVKVTLEGYRAQLSITSITEADYRTYILRIENSKGKAEQHVDFQRKAEKKDVTDIGLGVGVTVGVVVVVAVVTIVIVIRCRRNKQKGGVETVVKNESKYEDLQSRRETNVYNGPEIQVHNYTNASETSENHQFESLQNTDDNKSTYEEIRMTGDITPTS